VVDLGTANASRSELLDVVVAVRGLNSHDVVSLEKESDSLHVWDLIKIGLSLELVHVGVTIWLEDHSGSSLLKTNGGLLVHVGPCLLSPALESSLWLDGLLNGIDVNNFKFDSVVSLVEINSPSKEAESGCKS